MTTKLRWISALAAISILYGVRDDTTTSQRYL